MSFFISRKGAFGAALLLCGLMAFARPALAQHPAPAIGQGWAHRIPITLVNDGPELGSAQIRVELSAANFNFAEAAPDGRDLRVSDENGWTLLPHWVESYDPAAGRATLWLRVWSFPAQSRKTVFLYYGNPSAQNDANGPHTFEFFDDFYAGDPADAPGYFALGEPATALVKDQSWERTPPHTLSIVEQNADGFRYWGYYGLVECGGIGLARSNDLKTWTKYTGNPLLTRGGERWPSVLKAGQMLYMIADRDYCGTSYLALRKSADGLNWGGDTDYLTLVKPEAGIKNQNANFFYDPVGKLFYLYWYRGGPNLQLWQIRARSAATPEGLADPSTERVVVERDTEIAAPSLFYRDGIYFLSTEVNDRGWMTVIFEGKTPFGPFAPLAGNPVMGDNQACFFQHEFEGVLVGSLCKDTGPGGWQVNIRTAALEGRPTLRALDSSLWTARGNWAAPADGARAGGPNARLIGSWTDADYTAEARVRVVEYTPGQPVWSLGLRADEPGNAMYALSLVSRGDDALSYLITKTDAAGTQTTLAENRYALPVREGWCDASLAAQGGALRGRVACAGHVFEVSAVDVGTALPAGRLALLGGDGAQTQFAWARMRKNDNPNLRQIWGVAQNAAGQNGAWMGIRADEGRALVQNPPAHDAHAQAAITLGALALAAALVIGVGVAKKRGAKI